MQLELPDIDALHVGTWILGAGGGGDPYQGYLCVKQLLGEGAKIRLVDVASLDDDAWIACVNQMGSPLPAEERLVDPAFTCKAVHLMEAHQSIRFSAVMPWEIGGGNGFQGLIAAATLGLPLVDADAMGRAFPEASMTSFAVAGLTPHPLAMVDIRDNAVMFTQAADWHWLERMRRHTCTAFGALAATCNPPRTGREIKIGSHVGTVTQALELGRVVLDATARHADPVAAIVERGGGARLFRGKVSDVARRTTDSFLRGTVRIDGFDADAGHTFAIEFQNEFSVGYLDEAPWVMTPELICVIDRDTGRALGTERIRYGQRVEVIALPAPSLLLTDRGIELTGPRAFGYDLDFRSVFEQASGEPG